MDLQDTISICKRFFGHPLGPPFLIGLNNFFQPCPNLDWIEKENERSEEREVFPIL